MRFAEFKLTFGPANRVWVNPALVEFVADGDQDHAIIRFTSGKVQYVLGTPSEVQDKLAEATDAPAIRDYEAVLADHRRLVREIDSILNGEEVARQASLCDLIPEIRKLASRR